MYEVYEVRFNRNGEEHIENVEVSNFEELQAITGWLMSKGCTDIKVSFLYDEDEYWENYIAL